MKRTGNLAINSFEAIPADEKGVRPKSYAATAADFRERRVDVTAKGEGQEGAEGGCVPPAMTRQTSSKVAAKVKRRKKKIESASVSARVWNMLLRNASSSGVLEMTRANRFDVVGGAPRAGGTSYGT